MLTFVELKNFRNNGMFNTQPVRLRSIIGLIVLFLMTNNIARGQSFKAAVLAGINSSQVSGDELSGFNKVGLFIGGSAILPVSEKSLVEMELLFIQKGSKTPTPKNGAANNFYKMSLNYLEVPLIYTFRPVKYVSVHAGPTFGVLVGSKEEDNAGELTGQIPFQKTELGIDGGLSVYFSEHLSLTMRLSTSLLPIRKTGANTPLFESGQYNSGLAFFLQYTFGSKKSE
ncbi:MAG: PorT family protein [Bacteroidetes bacterium]|nr:PorT family protein [Bacteroidota bacterium]MCO5288013.1 PorT family protein [Bacteroidota bacterium]